MTLLAGALRGGVDEPARLLMQTWIAVRET